MWYAGELSAHGHAAAWNEVQCGCRVWSQAGVLCEMTTRADETQTPPPKPKERRQPSPAAWWGTWSSMSSQPLADTATLTPRHPPRGLLSISPTIAYLVHETPRLLLVANLSTPLSHRSVRINSQSPSYAVTTLQQGCSWRTETLVQCLKRESLRPMKPDKHYV